jgi:hypothetical protein
MTNANSSNVHNESRRPFVLLLSKPVTVQLPAAFHPDGIDDEIDIVEWRERTLERGTHGLTFEGPTIF